MYIVPELNFVEIENEDLKNLDCRLYNSPGISINEQTEIVNRKRVRGKIVEGISTLPTKHGPTNGILSALEIKKIENDDGEYRENITVHEVREEYKKTISASSKTIIQDPETQGFGGFSGSNESNVKSNYSTRSIRFENALKELIGPLKNLNYFSSVNYFLALDSHTLTLDTTPVKANLWGYIAINFGDIISRSVCVVELHLEEKRFYLIEIQPKASERFTMGIVALPDFSYMHDTAFSELKREIIKYKGIFKNIKNDQLVISSLKHFAERSKEKTGNEENIEKNNRQMAENIMQKIKKLRGL